MPTATISVEYVNQPKPGKKQGSIRTADGQYFGVDPTQLSQFAPGGTYTVEYDTHVYHGKEYKTFRRMDGSLPIIHGPVVGSMSHTKAVEMFTMGVIGRAMQGVGTLPDREILTTWVKACRRAWTDGFAAETDLDNPDF